MQVYRLSNNGLKVLTSLLFSLLLCICVPVYAAGSFDELINEVSAALKAGQAKQLSNTFASSINLSVKREEGVYTKFQAELLLEEFFRSNKVAELKEMQRVNNATNSYIVYSFKTSKSTYRVFIKLSPTNKDYQVVELRIE